MNEKSKRARKIGGWTMVAVGSLIALTGIAAIAATFGAFGFLFGGPVAVTLFSGLAIAIPGGLLTWLGLQMQGKAKHGLKLFEKGQKSKVVKEKSNKKERQNIEERVKAVESKEEEKPVKVANPVKKEEEKKVATPETVFVQAANSIAFFQKDGKTVLKENDKNMVFNLENKSNCNVVLRRVAGRATFSNEDYKVAIKGQSEEVKVLPLRHGHATEDCEKITSTIKSVTETKVAEDVKEAVL